MSNLTLAPKGSAGAEVTYTFHFHWAKDFAGVRDVLYREGKFDTRVVPGHGRADRSAGDVLAAHQERDHRGRAGASRRTRASSWSASRDDGLKVYRARFSRLGENMLTVRVRQRPVDDARVLRHRAARDRHPEARGVSRQPPPAHRSRRSGTRASTATGIRRTRSCAAPRIATTCRRG